MPKLKTWLYIRHKEAQRLDTWAVNYDAKLNLDTRKLDLRTHSVAVKRGIPKLSFPCHYSSFATEAAGRSTTPDKSEHLFSRGTREV